ncbi:hypothetical protein AA0113_g4827 [Alternaria arborescens]|jgi:hypothetical protein|uniref:C2H2-type domain-containing protein n=1 Tax=Alternaria arborescens TaxID=156630 RepID=A0A4Q4SA52_9PLEO|nr:hypothetical protein AA0111_g3862 [Alternaria arborescens]RYN30489.1 hypothetical protein AA0112_g6803 [Alternaria arborescens]RYO33597.1 hypothetical protein AA0111_g3862 [Alternaria arborescens]RYO67144.1 hypothetical protein AA0113_g4827 [Alternaria arborescens]
MANQSKIDPVDFGSYVNELLWKVLQLGLPEWYVHPIYKVLYPTETSFQEACTSIPLTFADGLLEMVNAASPPSLGDLKSLAAAPAPKALSKTWAVYLHVYELEGREPRIYVGSATNADYGAQERLSHYEKQVPSMLPRFVKHAVAQGFVKTHTTLLCWYDMPPMGLVTRARQRFLSLEGLFQMLFYSSTVYQLDGIWHPIMPWSRDDACWLPLNGQIALREHCRGDTETSPEALAVIAQNRAARKHARHKERSLASIRRNRHKWHVWSKTYFTKVRKARKIACDVCNTVFNQQYFKDIHMKSAKHKKNVATIANGGIVTRGAQAARSKRLRDANKASQRYPCHTCVHFFGEAYTLRRHLTLPSHAAAAAAADEAIEDVDSEHAIDDVDSECDSDCGSDFLSDIDSDTLSELGLEF